MNIYRFDPFIEYNDDDFETLVYEQLSQDPLSNIFNTNLKELRSNSDKIDFNSSRYDMRPDLVAWDNYQSIAVTNIILIVNKCPTFFNFTRDNVGDTILLPKKNYLQKLLNSQL